MSKSVKKLPYRQLVQKAYSTRSMGGLDSQDEDESLLNTAETQRTSFRPSAMEPDSLLDENRSNFDKQAFTFNESAYGKDGPRMSEQTAEMLDKDFEQERDTLSLFESFDRTFLHQAALQYFNQGARVLLNLAIQDLFKRVFLLEPSRLQTLLATIHIPWSCKIFFGFISDNIPFFGSRRKSYLVLGAIIQIISMATLAMFAYESVFLAAICTFMTTLSIAFCDVVTDSILIIQARKDPKNGSAYLSTFIWSAQSVGGLAGAISAAFLTQDQDPKVCFIIYAFLGIALLFSSIQLRDDIENEGRSRSEIESQNERNFSERINISFGRVKEALKIKEIHSIIIWMALYALLPNFGTFDYYFMLDVVGITQFQYSMISVLHYACMFVGSFVFRHYLKDAEIRTLTIAEVMVCLFCAPFTIMFVLRYNLAFGISDGFIIIFTDIVGDIFSMCLVVLPMCVLFTKICPKNIEATCFAMLAGLHNIKNSIRGYIGSQVNDEFIGVTRTNMDDFWKLKVISIVCSCAPLLFIFLLPTNKQINDCQAKLINSIEQEEEANERRSQAAQSTQSDQSVHNRTNSEFRASVPLSFKNDEDEDQEESAQLLDRCSEGEPEEQDEEGVATPQANAGATC